MSTEQKINNAVLCCTKILDYRLPSDWSEDYRGFLSWAIKVFKECIPVMTLRIKRKTAQVESLQKRIDRLHDDISDTRDSIKTLKTGIESVNQERSYGRKITNLAKKNDFLRVFYDFSTCEVHSGRFDVDGKDSCGKYDPYADDHFSDSFEEAHTACVEYINLFNAETN